MIYTEGLMHRKIKWWIAALAILILAALAAWAISVRAFSGVGLEINSQPKKCVYDSCQGCTTCYSTCPICGDLAGICSSLFEVQARFLSGTNLLHQNSALCLYSSQTTPPNGGSFRPGNRCVGIYYGTGPHVLFNFGCYP